MAFKAFMIIVVLFLTVSGALVLAVSSDTTGTAAEIDYDGDNTPNLGLSSGVINQSPVQSAANKTMYKHFEGELWPAVVAFNRAFHKLRGIVEVALGAVERSSTTGDKGKALVVLLRQKLKASWLHPDSVLPREFLFRPVLSDNLGEALHQMDVTVPSAVRRLLAIPEDNLFEYMDRELTAMETAAKEARDVAEALNVLHDAFQALLTEESGDIEKALKKIFEMMDIKEQESSVSDGVRGDGSRGVQSNNEMMLLQSNVVSWSKW